MCGRLLCWCTRDAAPWWQMCIGAPLLALLGLVNMALQPPGNPYFWLGVAIVLYSIYAYSEAYKKMTIDVSPGAYVTICDEVPQSSGLIGQVAKNHVGQVQNRVGGSVISVTFPPRATGDGGVLGGTFQIKSSILRQSDATAYNAQPVLQQQGYMPPTLGEPDMSRQALAPVVQAPAIQAEAVPAATTAASLTSTLSSMHLQQYEDALRGLGVVQVADLQDLDEADCMELGMKKLEYRRLQRAAQ